jgi:hypothetical protein
LANVIDCADGYAFDSSSLKEDNLEEANVSSYPGRYKA